MFTLAKEAIYEKEVKKSRFIAKASPISSVEEAFSFLARIREEKATHHCWAYKIGQHYRFFDDGEPSGTAGRPILSAIENLEIDGVMVVVVRYFGGIKLGAGGLARAYGGCSAKCLQTADLKRIVPMTEIEVMVGFDHIGVLYSLAAQFQATKLEERYTGSGLEVKLKIERTDCPSLVAALTDATAGQITVSTDC